MAGRVEHAVAKAAMGALRSGDIEAHDQGAVALAEALARAVDAAEAKEDLYYVCHLARELRQVLERLRLDPVSRGVGKKDDLGDLLAELAAADKG